MSQSRFSVAMSMKNRTRVWFDSHGKLDSLTGSLPKLNRTRKL